jgi:hypothetical protein
MLREAKFFTQLKPGDEVVVKTGKTKEIRKVDKISGDKVTTQSTAKKGPQTLIFEKYTAALPKSRIAHLSSDCPLPTTAQQTPWNSSGGKNGARVIVILPGTGLHTLRADSLASRIAYASETPAAAA